MNRRLYNPILEDHKFTPNPVMLTVSKVTAILGIVSLVLLMVLLYGLGANQLAAQWVNIVAVGLPPMLFLAALAFRFQYSIQKAWARRLVVWGLMFLVLVIGTIVFTFVEIQYNYGMRPVAYYTHPESGRRIVVMKGVDLESLDFSAQTAEDASGSKPQVDYYYGVYAMRNRFLIATLLGGEVKSNTGVDYVDWNEDGTVADAMLYDTSGEEVHIVVDFLADEKEIMAERMRQAEEDAQDASEPVESAAPEAGSPDGEED